MEGQLSREHGFLPAERTSLQLPPSHRAWDQAALQLPSLFFSNQTQAVLESLPILPADATSLPDRDLTRAAVVLSALAHAYWRFGSRRFYAPRITQVPGGLPTCLSEPWRTVSRRLERHHPDRPFQSFYDLFLSNYKLRASAAANGPVRVEDIEVLVPSFGNQAERVFYGAFIEMHYHFAPIVGALCQLEAAIVGDDAATVVSVLHQITECFQRATRVWKKISPLPHSSTYCDPVVWSKTVAILGVPPAQCPQGGTSGACAPVVYVMDALCRRTSFETYYGRYLQQDASPLVPKAVHQFAKRVFSLPWDAYLTRQRTELRTELELAMQRMVAAYAGRTGWLGRHASKAFSYLCISTITGRNASVSGHERYFSRQTWEQTAQNLNASRLERGQGCPHAAALDTSPTADRAPSSKAQEMPSTAAAGLQCPFHRERGDMPEASASAGSNGHDDGSGMIPIPTYTRAQVARHHHPGDVWVVIDGCVYDLSSYQHKHPGGSFILDAYAGQEVTQVFRSQNVHSPEVVDPTLRRCFQGRLLPELESARPVYALLFTLLRAKQALKMQFQHSFPQTPALKLYSDEQAHMQLWLDKLPAAYASLAGDWDAVLNTPAARTASATLQWVSESEDLRMPLSLEAAYRTTRRGELLQSADEGLLERLFEETLACIEIIERGADPAPELQRLTQCFRSELSACLETLTDGVRTLQHEIEVLFRRSVPACNVAA